MLAGEYCNRNVTVVSKQDSIVKAAKIMRESHVGDVLVCESRDGDRIPVGILTDRDIVIEVVAKEIDPDLLVIDDVMSFKLVTAHEDDDLMSVIKRMRINGVRRIPIVNKKNALIGILSADDILEVVSEQLLDLEKIIENEYKKEQKERPSSLRH